MASAAAPDGNGRARVATRLAFLVAGFGMSCWAPLVPLAKARIGADDALLGLLLLCIGAGSIVAMVATGPLTSRLGSRPVIVASGVALALVLPLLTLATTPVTLGAALLLFGAALGSLDVSANVHAVEVERRCGRPLMSGFHALFSLGGFAGAGLMTAFLTLRVAPPAAALACAVLMLGAVAIASRRLLRIEGASDGPLFVRPRGIVLALAILSAMAFLAEGAVLDWSALLTTQAGLVAPAQGGIPYILFSIAMTAGRLVGDRLTARLGDRRTMLGGALVAAAGFAVVLVVPSPPIALAGFLLVGLGAANIVPVLFRLAGAQTRMPPALAIAAVTTVGYAGILAGPAGIGVLADVVGLDTAFWLLAGLMLVIAASARAVTAR